MLRLASCLLLYTGLTRASPLTNGLRAEEKKHGGGGGGGWWLSGGGLGGLFTAVTCVKGLYHSPEIWRGTKRG